jgi:hypothetical protein
VKYHRKKWYVTWKYHFVTVGANDVSPPLLLLSSHVSTSRNPIPFLFSSDVGGMVDPLPLCGKLELARVSKVKEWLQEVAGILCSSCCHCC